MSSRYCQRQGLVPGHAEPWTLAVRLFEGEDHDIHGSRSGQLGPAAYTMVADWLADRARGVEAKPAYTEVDATGMVHVEPWGEGKWECLYGLTKTTRKLVFADALRP